MRLKFMIRIILLFICIVVSQCTPKPKWENFQGGNFYIIEIIKSGNSEEDIFNTEKTATLLQKRVEDLKIKDPIVKKMGDYTIGIQTVASLNLDNIFQEDGIMRGYLEFRLVEEELQSSHDTLNLITEEQDILPYAKRSLQYADEPEIVYVTNKEPKISGQHIRQTRINRVDSDYFINITLDDKGSELLESITSKNIGKQMATVFDDQIIFIARIKNKIVGCDVQLGAFTKSDAEYYNLFLNSGSLPARFRLIESMKINKDNWFGN